MRKVFVCVLGVAWVAAAAAAGAASLKLEPTKDARVLGHRSEVGQNCGRSSRLRTVGIKQGSAEFVIMDFDRAALKAFLEKNEGKTISGKLVLVVRQVQGPKTKLEVATIDAGVDWVEGTKSQQDAEKGECCALWAQQVVKKWAPADGKEVGRFKELVYDGEKVTTVLNSKGVELAKDDGGKTVEIELDEKLVKHLGTNQNCRGLFLFHRDPQAKVDVFSREQNRKQPRLVVTAE